MRRLSRLFLILQIFILGLFSFLLFFKIFFPYLEKKSSYVEISPEKIVFKAQLNPQAKDILSLISFDVRSYLGSLGLWDKEVFQRRLNQRSLLLTDLDLEVFQDWLITNQIDYYHPAFKGRIILVFEGKDFQGEVEASLLVKNYSKLALENMIFLGLGLSDFVRNFSFSPYEVSSQTNLSIEDFLEGLFKKPELRLIIDDRFLPQKRGEVKVIIFK